MCRGPGTGVYIPPFLLVDDAAGGATQSDRTGDLPGTKHPGVSTHSTPPAPATRSTDSRRQSFLGTYGSCNGSRSFSAATPRSPDCWQTFQPAGASCSPDSSFRASPCAGWDLTFPPPCQSSGPGGFNISPMPAPLCGFSAGAVQQMAAQGPAYPEDDMDEIDCRLQQLLARKEALLRARAAAASAAQAPIPMPATPPQQAIMPQQLGASQAMCCGTSFCWGSEAMMGGLGCCSGDVLVTLGSEPPAPTPAPASFCMLPDLPSAGLAPCMPAGLASPAAGVPLACAPLSQGVQQVCCSTMARDKLRELSEMQQLEAALTDDLLQLLPIF